MPIIHQLAISMNKFVQTPSQYFFGMDPFAIIAMCCSFATTPRNVYLHKDNYDKMIKANAQEEMKLSRDIRYFYDKLTRSHGISSYQDL